jgi:hypothetical protein
MDHELKDVYFRRFLVPLIITLLVLCGIVVIVSNVPGTPVQSVFMAGGFKKFIK